MADPILSIENLTLAMANGVTSITEPVTASAVTNLFPRLTSLNSTGGQEEAADLMLHIDFLTGPNRVRLTRGWSDGALEIEISLTEFDTNEVTVQGVTWALANTELTDAVTVNAVNLDKTFGTFSQLYNGANTALDNCSVRGQFSADDTFTLERGGGTQACSGSIVLVEDDGTNFDVQNVTGLSMIGTSADFTLNSVDEGRTQVLCSQSLSANGSADILAVGFLNSDTVFRATRETDTGTCEIDGFVITWTAAANVTIQRGSINLTDGTGTDTNTAVVLANSCVGCPMALSTASSDATAFRNAAYVKVRQSSTTGIEAEGAGDASNKIVHWELMEFSLAVDESLTTAMMGAIF